MIKNSMAGTEYEVARTSTPVFVITDKTLRAVEKLVDSLKKLGIKYVDGELAYDEKEAGYEYLFEIKPAILLCSITNPRRLPF